MPLIDDPDAPLCPKCGVPMRGLFYMTNPPRLIGMACPKCNHEYRMPEPDPQIAKTIKERSDASV